MNIIKLLALSSLVLLPSLAFARDDVGAYSIADALNSETAKTKLGDDVAFYFGDQEYAEPEQRFIEYSVSKKTNAFNKTDEDACNWVFLSAMIALKNKAIAEGGNAVVDIKSNYRNNLTSNSETFQCGAGAIIAGVALSGKVVTLK